MTDQSNNKPGEPIDLTGMPEIIVPGIDEDRGVEFSDGQALYDQYDRERERLYGSGGVDPNRPIGRGNPPRKGQWEPGQSGNFKGRPTVNLTLKDVATQALSKTVTLNENGRQVQISLTEAMIRSVAQKTAKDGSPTGLRALKPFMDMAEHFGQREETDDETTDRMFNEMTPEEWQKLHALKRDLEQYLRGDETDDVTPDEEPPSDPERRH